MPTKIDISYKTILFTVFIIILLWLLIQIREILIILFVSAIITATINNWVLRLEKLRIPHPLAIGIIYLFLIGVIILFLTIVFPPLINESLKLAMKAPQYSENLLQVINIDVGSLTQQIATFSSSALKLISGIFSDVFALITILVISFYMLLERKNLDVFFRDFLKAQTAENAIKITKNIENRLGGWVRGQILLCIIIGLMSYVGLRILNIDYALSLAIIAGVLEIVPVIGPIISAIPAVVIALTNSPNLALMVITLYIVVQQTENHLIVPKVMHTAVGLKPIATIIALMIGGKLLGIVGVLLAVPIVIVIQEIISEVLFQKKILTKT
jgi:predicted PurR-regulated permease PerM